MRSLYVIFAVLCSMIFSANSFAKEATDSTDSFYLVEINDVPLPSPYAGRYVAKVDMILLVRSTDGSAVTEGVAIFPHGQTDTSNSIFTPNRIANATDFKISHPGSDAVELIAKASAMAKLIDHPGDARKLTLRFRIENLLNGPMLSVANGDRRHPPTSAPRGLYVAVNPLPVRSVASQSNLEMVLRVIDSTTYQGDTKIALLVESLLPDAPKRCVRSLRKRWA
jgi:hypothetical protein